MTSSLHGPYELGYTRATMVITIRGNNVKVGANLQKLSQFGLWAATRPYEVGIASNRKTARCGEYVTKLCTDRPSHTGSRLVLKFVFTLFIKKYREIIYF